MSEIFIKTQDAVAGLLALILTSLLGWRLYFHSKWTQLDRIENKLDEHIEDEENKIDKVHDRVNKIWEHLARSD